MGSSRRTGTSSSTRWTTAAGNHPILMTASGRPTSLVTRATSMVAGASCRTTVTSSNTTGTAILSGALAPMVHSKATGRAGSTGSASGPLHSVPSAESLNSLLMGSDLDFNAAPVAIAIVDDVYRPCGFYLQ